MGDPDTDPLIPVKDTNLVGGNRFQDAVLEQKAIQQRGMIARWERDVLEDKYLRLYEENLLLKKHARKQEDKIKRMATKLLRLVNDKKKSADKEGGKKGRDVETEERLEELYDRIRDLDKQNQQLKEKLMIAKQQLATSNKRTTPYNHVQARINTGIPRSPPDPRLAKNIRVMGPPEHVHSRAPHSPTMQRYGHSMLEETRMENRKLEEVIAQQQERIDMYEIKLADVGEKMRLKDDDYQEDMLKMKYQMTAEHRVSVHENIDMIKVQRDVKDKSTKLIALQDKYVELDENMKTVKRSHDNLLREMESLNLQVKQEENKVMTLQNELKRGMTNQRKLIEVQEQVTDLQKENIILKEANEKLVTSAFDLEREREWRQRENYLKVQIAQLEATLKADLGEKGGILDRLSHEKEEHEKLQSEFQKRQIEYFEVKEQLDDLTEKMKFFTKGSGVDFTEIEEALVLVKHRKQKAIKEPDFLQRVDDELHKDMNRQLLELQAEYAETVHELEKTRNMLVVQHKINKDYQQEVEICTQKLEETKKEYEMKLDEYARLLDIRAARVKKLENQLRDVAYGTKQYKMPPPGQEDLAIADFDETIHLERGQNLFEIHIQKVNLSADGLKEMNDDEPSTFCTWEFFEFELQATPVMRGSRPEFDFTSQYTVKVDDFFLHYLQKETCTLELHQSFGQDYQTVAACQLIFTDIFEKPCGRLHGTASLTGIDADGTGLGFGTVDFWIRLRVPMDQALRLYKERTKALGYLSINKLAATQALQALDDTVTEQPADNINELHIKIIRCSRLRSRRPNVQPSPYCVYQFFDFNDHDTSIIPSTNNPEFNDHQTFSLPMVAELDKYLKSLTLQIFVFDDTDPEQTAYIGIADIPLIPLAHNNMVIGIFELRGADSKVNGTVEVELRWQFTYIPPKTSTRTQAQIDAAPDEIPEKLVVLPGEESTIEAPSGSRTRIAARFPPQGPSATSTPLPKKWVTGEQEQELQEAVAMAVTAGPAMESKKPSAKRHLEIVEEEQPKSLVDEAVSRVVSDLLPTTSVSDQTTVEPSISDLRDREDESVMAPISASVEKQQAGPMFVEQTMETDEDSTEGESKTDVASPKEATSTMDTMFGDPPEKEVEEELTTTAGESTLQENNFQRQDTEEEESETPAAVESDSEGLCMVPTPSKRRARAAVRPSNNVTITISTLSLEDDSSPALDDDIRQLFVEYRFLDISPQELETPYSLPKPKPGHLITFNFSKTFAVDMHNHYERRRILASMLLPGCPDDGRLRFTIVSEPPEDESEVDCVDVGIAFVNIKDILIKKKNVIDQDLDVLDVHDEKTVIGSLKASVECLAALRAVEKEMQVDGTY